MDFKIIFGFILGIIGSFFGAFIAHLFGEHRRMKEDFNKAAAEFRDAFIKTKRLLEPNSVIDRSDAGSAMIIIKNNIDEHEIAMMKFRHFVSKGRLGEYKKAWHDYADKHRDHNEYSGNDLEKKEEGRKLALSRINTLLEFARPKHKLCS